MATAVPKNKLIREILGNFPENAIRTHFNIVHSQNLEIRLDSFLKTTLEGFLRSSEEGANRLRQLEERYPQDMPGTFFLVKVVHRKYTTEIFQTIRELAHGGRDAGLHNPNRSVRAIYIDQEGILAPDFNLVEIPLVFEHKLEYSIGDPPDSDRYGELEHTYSLKRAYVWLLDDYTHGLVCCSEMAGLNAILYYFYKQLGIKLSLPDMTQDIFTRLVEEGDPSSATFRGFPANVPTISVYAPGIAEYEIYQELSEDPDREQVAGFFRGKENAFFASFGISRKYARIWTPWRYSKPFLMSTATEIIHRTEEELSREFENNVLSYTQYFSGVLVEIDEKTLAGLGRSNFQKLIEWIVGSQRVRNNEITLENDDIFGLIKTKNMIDLALALQLDCPNCGGGLCRCPDCITPYQVKISNENLVVYCPKCRYEIEDQHIRCECGTDLEFAVIANHIRLFPGFDLQQAIIRFIDEQLDDFDWHGTFVIEGLLFKALSIHVPKNIPEIIRLTDLSIWQQHARIHHLQPRASLLPIVSHTKEKCRRNGTPPNQEKCNECLAGQITENQIRTRGEVCSPRVMGLAINQTFDGIHHSHEVADVRYSDQLADSGLQIDLGIHLKSRQNHRPEGLGRSVYAIKSLYTQIFYSAYQALLDREVTFDAIGISIPNTIHPDVINSIQALLNQLGFSLLVIEEDDWLRIFDAALSNIVFQAEGIS